MWADLAPGKVGTFQRGAPVKGALGGGEELDATA